MSGLKLTCASLTVLLCLWCPAVRGGTPSPPAPELSDTQRTFLSNVARRTVRDVLMGRKLYQPDYVPAALEAMKHDAIVRLRLRGFLLASAAAGSAPVAVAVRDAAAGAARLMNDPVDGEFEPARRTRDAAAESGTAPAPDDDAVVTLTAEIDAATVPDLLIEIEVVGAAEPIEVNGPWTEPRVLDRLVEPGIHGLVLTGPGVTQRLCPTELFTSDLILAEALQRIARSASWSESQLADVGLKRFRTVHWYEPRSGDDIVSLTRGLTLIPPEAVTPAGLDQAVARVAEYMQYRQLDDGLFAYQYEPGSDAYSTKNNLVRQVGAAAAMAMDARVPGRSASRAAADLAIRHHLQGLSDVPGAAGTGFIATADGKNKLGVTALLCLAMLEHPDTDHYAEPVDKLVSGMLWLQRPSGMFLTAFPPAFEVESQDYFPGEALLALATFYAKKPSGAVMDAFDRAVAFYRGYFQGAPSPAFVPWQVQSFVIMARQSGRRDFAEYVFHMTDWLADKQLHAGNCPWEDLWGGIAAYSDGRAGVATAAYLEGFADALELARHMGDSARADRYAKVVRAASRFVLQLQVRPEEAYFVCSPRDATGGIRTSPSLNLLRIDHAQHGLVGLTKARRALFPE